MSKHRTVKKEFRPLSEADLQQMLLTKQRELLASIRRERRGLRDGAVELAASSLGDQAARPVLRPEAEIGYEVVGHRADLLTQIDLALEKLEEGTYGRCEMCEEPIPPARLEALPFAIRCTDCQETWERERRRTRGESVYAREPKHE